MRRILGLQLISELILATATITASSVDDSPNGCAVSRRSACMVAAAAKMSDMKSRKGGGSPPAVNVVSSTERVSPLRLRPGPFLRTDTRRLLDATGNTARVGRSARGIPARGIAHGCVDVDVARAEMRR